MFFRFSVFPKLFIRRRQINNPKQGTIIFLMRLMKRRAVKRVNLCKIISILKLLLMNVFSTTGKMTERLSFIHKNFFRKLLQTSMQRNTTETNLFHRVSIVYTIGF